MKKIMALCIGIIIFLSGCSKATTENDELITDGTVTDVPEIYSENDNTEDVSHEHTDTEVKISIGGYFAVSFFLFRSIHDLHQLKKA